MAEYYISSNKCSIHQRKTKKHGTVYDVYFRIIEMKDLTERQHKLSGFSTKTLAKQAHLKFVQEYCELLPAHLKNRKKDPAKRDLTVGELIPEYLTSLANQNKDSSIYDKKNIYNLFVLPQYQNTKIIDLTKEELYRWQDAIWAKENPRTKEHYSYKYLSKVRSHFSAFLTWCESRYGYKNFLSEVNKPKKRAAKTEMKIWTSEEFDQFLAVVKDPEYHALFTLMFFTGRRKGELFALSPEDIKLHSPTPSILFSKSITRKTLDDSPYKITSTKADKEQKIPVCQRVVEELQTIYQGKSPFFFGGEKPLAENTVSRVFKKYCEQAEMDPIRIHDLRHSFVSMLIHHGANYMVVADLIGDTPEQVLKTYAHLYDTDKTDIILRINQYQKFGNKI